MRRALIVVTAALLAGGLVGASAAGASGNAPHHVTVDITGSDSMVPNRSFTNTYRFPDVIKVARGGTITFVNKTTDGHTMTMVVKGDLPTTPAGVNNCPICDAVNAMYSPNGQNGPPAIAQIDGGHPTDDPGEHDADQPDPGVPPGFPVKGLIEDFNTPAHTNGNAAPKIGDSTIIGPVGSPVTQRTVVLTAPGTYHYYCTFHPWMQGTIIVTP
jgi:plastocyanin